MVIAETFGEYVIRVLTDPFLRFDLWDVVGFFGQSLFFTRFIVQWIASEKKQRNVLPVAFWYFSMAGAFVSLLYFIHLGRLPLIMAGMASMVIYSRNLHIWFKRKTSRRGLVFSSGAVPTEVDFEPSEDSGDRAPETGNEPADADDAG